MLNDYVRPEQPSKEDVRERVRTEQSKLSTYGMKIKEAKLPVMVIFEGWGSSGKGSAIANVIKNIDRERHQEHRPAFLPGRDDGQACHAR